MAPFARATPTLTRRVKQAISEWYVLNMLELAWAGSRSTPTSYDIGKPPYGYQARHLRHPVEAKALQGRHKHKLVIDPTRGPVVTQIFQWWALKRLSYQAIADRLNLDPERYPPPEPIPGEAGAGSAPGPTAPCGKCSTTSAATVRPRMRDPE